MKRLLFLSLCVFLLAVSAIYICNSIIIKAADGKLYSTTVSIPYNRVGLLLGTSKFTADGKRLNLFYRYRIDAAVELVKAGKIKYLVISGDNGRDDYNEPATMRNDLILAGVDSAIIYPDYAGFRTFDSMIRLKEIFSQDSVTIISQKFHNERALYIASKLNISTVGFNAKDVSSAAGFKTNLREKFARVKVFLDFWFETKPKFLGEKVNIPQ